MTPPSHDSAVTSIPLGHDSAVFVCKNILECISGLGEMFDGKKLAFENLERLSLKGFYF
jgi:hypothetical protein